MDKYLLHTRHRGRRLPCGMTSDYGPVIANCILTTIVFILILILWSQDPNQISTGYPSSVDNEQLMAHAGVDSEEMMAPTTSRILPQDRDQYDQLIPVFHDKNGNHFVLRQHLEGYREMASIPRSSTLADAQERTNPERDVDTTKLKENASLPSISNTKAERTQTIDFSKKQDLSKAKSTDRSSFPVISNVEDPSTRTVPRSTAFLVASSCAIVLGVLTTKRAIQSAQKWKQRSLEDSLAYDMAYTDTRSDYSYGSFVSAAWSDELNKFEV